MPVGFDIGTYTLKGVELKKKGKSFEVLRAASILNTTGKILPADAKERGILIEQIYRFFQEYGLPMRGANLALPESFISTKLVSMPLLNDAELASAIGWQAEQYIPVPIDQLQLEYQVLYRPPKGTKDNMRVLLIGAQKTLVQQYTELFSEAGIEIGAMETQTLALYRALMAEHPEVTTLLLHIGASTMDFLVYHEGELVFVYSHPNGGGLLTRSLERSLGFDTNQAEEYKRTYGLDERQLEGKIYQVMLPIFKSFVAEVQKAIQYFSNAHGGVSIKRVMCSGGTATLPNFIPLLASSLGLEVSVFQPFASMTFKQSVKIQDTDMSSYSVAVGLAMRQE